MPSQGTWRGHTGDRPALLFIKNQPFNHHQVATSTRNRFGLVKLQGIIKLGRELNHTAKMRSSAERTDGAIPSVRESGANGEGLAAEAAETGLTTVFHTHTPLEKPIPH